MSGEFSIPFSRPWVDEDDIERVAHVLRSGWWTTGSTVRQLEEQFAEYVGSRSAVAVNSCTAALHLALAALEIMQGDLVVTTTMTFAATAEVIAYMGAVPVLLDVDPETLNISSDQFSALCSALADDDPTRALNDSVRAGLLPRGVLRSVPHGCAVDAVKAVIPVHFAGLPCEMDAIMDTARRYSVEVIEDAAHAVEAMYKGAHAGTIGRVGCFSFYATKNLSTGEGGMITTEDADLADRMRRLSLHGISKDAWKRYTASGTWRYDILEPGFKYNMTDVLAAIGVGQLSRIERLYELRMQVVRAYSDGLSDLNGLAVPAVQGDYRHAWHLYVVRVKDEGSQERDRFIEELRARGIGTSVHFIPLHLHSYYRKTYGYETGDYPCAERAFQEVVSLPLYPSLSGQEVARVIATVRDVMPGLGPGE